MDQDLTRCVFLCFRECEWTKTCYLRGSVVHSHDSATLNNGLQRCAKQLSHITSSFPEQEEDTRNAETTPAHPER
jgi:hypothetical protein